MNAKKNSGIDRRRVSSDYYNTAMDVAENIFAGTLSQAKISGSEEAVGLIGNLIMAAFGAAVLSGTGMAGMETVLNAWGTPVYSDRDGVSTNACVAVLAGTIPALTHEIIVNGNYTGAMDADEQLGMIELARDTEAALNQFLAGTHHVDEAGFQILRTTAVRRLGPAVGEAAKIVHTLAEKASVSEAA